LGEFKNIEKNSQKLTKSIFVTKSKSKDHLLFFFLCQDEDLIEESTTEENI
jgi:hypothetical protein